MVIEGDSQLLVPVLDSLAAPMMIQWTPLMKIEAEQIGGAYGVEQLEAYYYHHLWQ